MAFQRQWIRKMKKVTSARLVAKSTMRDEKQHQMLEKDLFRNLENLRSPDSIKKD